ncbi:MAG: hypothetical protein M0Q13_15670 [Methanothrix sp.]|jgi:RNA polymerase sigma factor (sigma-70 family)|nr:hypothetical protein [Methanothrix sp.]
MHIREFIETKEGKSFINGISHKLKYKYLSSVDVKDIENELYLLLLEKESEYNEQYSAKTFVYNFLIKRLLFIIRKKYFNYFHTENGYEFIENVDLSEEFEDSENNILDTEMVENIDSEIFVNEFLSKINDREIIIDRMSGLTLEEIGKKMGVSGEMVRQKIQKVSKNKYFA